MKILPVRQIRKADAYTITHKPLASSDLMEKAGTQCFNWIRKRISTSIPVIVFCGPGNNGGDGLVTVRLLARQGYQIKAYLLMISNKFSGDFQLNLDRLQKTDGAEIIHLTEKDTLPEIPENALVIDAIFGSGLSRPVTGFPASVIRHINHHSQLTIAIDIPSGLYADEHTASLGGAIIEAAHTLSFQFPKFSFLFAENEKFVGNWHILPIGLMKEFTDTLDIKNFTVERKEVTNLRKQRSRFAHKGHFGHALLIAGSYGKMGAALLAARAALRAGAGLVTAHIPKKGYEIIQTAVPEAMVSIDEQTDHFSRTPELSLFNAIGIGPGLGTAKETQQAMKLLIQNTSVPLLVDADGINILSENKTWLSFLPAKSILTPHPKEFERLFGKCSNDFERNRRQREFSAMHNIYIILKGAYTCISTPEGKCFFNTTGNPGMATGGSGDVLTGIILGLLAQHYHPQEACILGVYLHGLAGDLAAKKQSPEALIAGDIIENLGKAFRKIM